MSDNVNRTLIAVIGDEDTITGLLLAGIGQVSADNNKNFHIIKPSSSDEEIESKFKEFTQERSDIAIVLITQAIAERIRQVVDSYEKTFPTVLEIPSKDSPYDPEKDSVLRRVRRLFGE